MTQKYKLCVLSFLLQECRTVAICVQPCLLGVLSEHLYYDEIAVPFTRMQNECKQLISLLADAHIDIGNRINCSVFTIDQANDLVSRGMPALHSNLFLSCNTYSAVITQTATPRNHAIALYFDMRCVTDTHTTSLHDVYQLFKK